ncbi:hypothetical protein [Thermoflexus sp.]|uniref:hypothetical protein n=1 Tax=Thermoflexus sp. TaxID=1969742 RepID=UPI002ADE0C48|nr:hypothetical protein [Thermoflexus sp.]
MVRMISILVLFISLFAASPVFAQSPTPTPSPRLRDLSLEGYFDPLPIADPDPRAQMVFVPIDLRLISRAAITFWNMVNFGGWLSWVGAFAVAGMAIIGLIKIIFFREGL